VHVIKLTHRIVHRDIQEVCRRSRILTALVLKFARGCGNGSSIDFYLTLDT